MAVTITQIQAYDSVDDRDIICMYQKSPSEVFVAVLLMRYEHLMYRIISQWNTRRHALYTTDSDIIDMRHYAYNALVHMMIKVKRPLTIKNMGTRIKSYINNELNKHYKHRMYEENSGMVVPDIKEANVNEIEDSYLSEITTEMFKEDIFLVYVFHYNYSYYKIGLLTSGSTSRKFMMSKYAKIKRKLLDRLRRKYSALEEELPL